MDPAAQKALEDIACMLDELADMPRAVIVQARDALADILYP